jgi:hypothetical protein
VADRGYGLAGREEGFHEAHGIGFHAQLIWIDNAAG